MGNKNKTISFRVNEDKFQELRAIAEKKDISLSTVFRDYVDEFITHEGDIEITGESESPEASEFPPKVTVPTEHVREYERLQLENEHLHDQIEEYEAYIERLQSMQQQSEDNVVHLEDLDNEDRPIPIE